MDISLYLLVTKARDKLKIGVSLDAHARSSDLSRDWGQFDLANSYYVRGGKLEIEALEKTLHFLFRGWRITDKACDKPGYTEWFHAECLENVINEIARIGDLQKSPRVLIKGLNPSSARTSNRQQKSPLAGVLFKTYRYKVLQLLLLNPDEALGTRSLARTSGLTGGAVHREAALLSQAGILKRTQSGNQVKYQANKDCPAFSGLVSILSIG